MHKGPNLKGLEPGSGKRFKRLQKYFASKPGVYNPAGLAAHVEMEKYGKKKLQEYAQKARNK